MIEHIPATLLEPAVEAARRALRKLEDRDVPASLRRVAGYGGGSLPPPLLRSLIVALDEDEWLRAEALEQWKDADTDAPGPAGASALFLLRPSGWQLELGRRTAILDSAAASGELAGLQQRLAELEAEAAEARRRARSALKESAEEALRSRREVESVRRQLRAARREDRQQDDELAAQVAELELARAAAEDAHADIDRLAARLRQDLSIARRERAATERRLAAYEKGGVWAATDALELARHLDDVARAARPPAAIAAVPSSVAAAGWELPSGFRPDAASAVGWLLEREDPFTLLVDGYNVGFHLETPAADPARMRARLNHELAAFRRLARAPVRLVVVYDGAGESTGSGPGGIEERFTAGGITADEVIVAEAEAATGPVVVISSDREVRDGARGALGLWSEALGEWIRQR